MILFWQQIPSAIISEIFSKNSDGVVLDTEHGVFNNEALYSCIQIIKLQNKKCFVRLTEISKTQIRYCLDAGVDGIIFSTIETEQQCKDIIDNCYYAPIGRRGLGLVRQNHWGEKKLINNNPIIIPQIETKNAVENLEKIIHFNFDYYLIGPYDLSLSLEIPGQFDNEKFLFYISKIQEKIPEDKRAIHIPNNIEKEIKKYKNYGIKCLGMDTTELVESSKRIIKWAC